MRRTWRCQHHRPRTETRKMLRTIVRKLFSISRQTTAALDIMAGGFDAGIHFGEYISKGRARSSHVQGSPGCDGWALAIISNHIPNRKHRTTSSSIAASEGVPAVVEGGKNTAEIILRYFALV